MDFLWSKAMETQYVLHHKLLLEEFWEGLCTHEEYHEQLALLNDGPAVKQQSTSSDVTEPDSSDSPDTQFTFI